MNFHHIAVDRLEKIRPNLKGEPDFIADRMVHGRFERVKCSYGTAASSALPTIPIEVPGLDPGYSFPNANIEDSKMIIAREELKGLFDFQVDKMLSVIDEQLDRMHQYHPRIQIVEWPSTLYICPVLTSRQKSYLVLSGGLGSSPYVRQRLRSHYETGPGSHKFNAQDIKIVIVAEP